MKYLLRFTFVAAIAAVALWSCEKAEFEITSAPLQEDVVQESQGNVIDEMSRATKTINSILDEQLDDVSAAVADIAAAPDNVFPSPEIKECVINLLRSVIPQDTTITRTLPFFFSNIDDTFEIMGALVAQLRLKYNNGTGLFEIGPSSADVCLAHFVTSSGDTLSIGFSDSKGSEYEGFGRSSKRGYSLFVEKNDSIVFEILSEDEKDTKIPSIFSGSGLEFRHTHSGSLSISAINILLDYDVDFTAGNMKYDFAMSMPMFAEADTLLKITGDFQQKGFGLNRKIESDQWFSMMDKGININVKSSDLKKMVGLMAATLLMNEPGYPEKVCKDLSDKWGETASISVYAGAGLSGPIELGYRPVDEEDPESELYVPAFLVINNNMFGEELTISEFIEFIMPMLPEISLPF